MPPAAVPALGRDRTEGEREGRGDRDRDRDADTVTLNVGPCPAGTHRAEQTRSRRPVRVRTGADGMWRPVPSALL